MKEWRKPHPPKWLCYVAGVANGIAIGVAIGWQLAGGKQ